MTRCPLDGSVRIPILEEPGLTIRRCPWCGQVSEERLTTDDTRGNQ